MKWTSRDRFLDPCKAFALCVMVAFCAGCTQETVNSTLEKVGAGGQEPVGAHLSTDELAEQLQRTLTSAQETEQLLETPTKFRYDRLKSQLNTGVAIADRLIAHPDATEAQISAAWVAKVKMLHKGAQQMWSGFDDRLETAASQLRERHPDSAIAELADALCVEQVYQVRGVDAAKVRKRLAEHAKRYPDGKTAPSLYIAFGKKLRGEKRHQEAAEVVRDGARLLTSNPHAAALVNALGSAERSKQLAAQRRQAAYQELAPVRSKLGSDQGVFLLQAHEQDISNPQYQYEFKIVNGIKEAKVWVDQLANDRWRRGWVWRVYRRYPATKAGMEQAKVDLETMMNNPALRRAG